MSAFALNPSPPAGNRPWFPRPGRAGGLVLAGLLCLGGLAAPGAEAEISKEYQLKAAYLYNFTKFVEWPREHFAAADSPIIIALLGDKPFGEELARVVRGRKVNGHPLVVQLVASAAEAGSACLLFVSAHAATTPGVTREMLHLPGVLTVGESPAFAATGGIITFTLAADKVRFEINLTAAEQSGLKLSSQLLTLATVVRRQP